MHLGHRDLVSRHADEADQTLLARLDGRFERAARPHHDLPLIGCNQVVKLEQVNMIRLEPLQRPMDPLPGRLIRPLAGFRRQEKLLPVPLHPRADAQFRVAVAEGGIDVVDAELQQQIKGAIGFGLGDARQGRRAEDRAGAQVAGAAKWRLGDHILLLCCSRKTPCRSSSPDTPR